MDDALRKSILMETIRIRKNEWEIFKILRLKALELDGNQFGQSLEDVREYPDEKWQEDAMKAAESDEFYIVLAFDRGKAVGMTGCVRAKDFGKIIKHKGSDSGEIPQICRAPGDSNRRISRIPFQY